MHDHVTLGWHASDSERGQQVQVDHSSDQHISFCLRVYAHNDFHSYNSEVTMSNVSTPTDSPVHAEPLHNPDRAAQVVVPQAPLGNATNGKIVSQMPGMGAKALLAKKMAKGRCVGLLLQPKSVTESICPSAPRYSNPKFISPTDNMMTPCSQKISAAKKKRFDK